MMNIPLGKDGRAPIKQRESEEDAEGCLHLLVAIERYTHEEVFFDFSKEEREVVYRSSIYHFSIVVIQLGPSPTPHYPPPPLPRKEHGGVKSQGMFHSGLHLNWTGG